MTFNCPSALAAATRASMPPRSAALVAVFAFMAPVELAGVLAPAQAVREIATAAAMATPDKKRFVIKVSSSVQSGQFALWDELSNTRFWPVSIVRRASYRSGKRE